ncbi:MAG: hypothetical protein FD119_2598 [Stygiobacter sp.]|nr:MAG: hypothetical protein FD119_2598 [Stygiobacter sp.]
MYNDGMRSLLAHACLLIVLALARADAHAQTWEQYNDPGYWQRQRASVLSRDNPNGPGMNLAERANYCEEQSYRVSHEVDRAGAFIIDNHMLASPGRGYITQGAAVQDQREMNTLATVAFRDMREAKYSGANVARCSEIANTAIREIQNVLRKYPNFNEYDPNSSTAYR